MLEILGFSAAVPKVSPADAHHRQNAGDAMIIDVREPYEWYQTGSPLGSLRISMNDPNLAECAKNFVSEYPDAMIIVSCKSGTRATTTAKKLSKNGIENLAVLKGGIFQWNAEKLPSIMR